MFKWFLKADKGADLVSRWFLVYSLMTGAYAWLATHVPLFAKLNWAELIFVGIICALATMLAVAATLALIRYFRPLSQSEIPLLDHPTAAMNFDELREGMGRIASRTEEGKSMIEGLIVAFNQEKGHTSQQIADLRDELTDHKEHVSQCYSAQDAARQANVDSLKQEIEARVVTALAMVGDVQKHAIDDAKELRERAEKIEQWVKTIYESVEHRFGNLDLAFTTLGNREKSERLFRDLREDFDALARPVDEGTGIPDWPAWQKAAKNWRGKLDEWLLIADYYASGSAEYILSQPEHVYEGVWSFDETALKATEVHRFKELAIWWQNAQTAKAQVDKAMGRTVFNAPSRKGRPDEPPSLDDMD